MAYKKTFDRLHRSSRCCRSGLSPQAYGLREKNCMLTGSNPLYNEFDMSIFWAAPRFVTPVDAAQKVSILVDKMTCQIGTAFQIQSVWSCKFEDTLIWRKRETQLRQNSASAAIVLIGGWQTVNGDRTRDKIRRPGRESILINMIGETSILIKSWHQQL